jgi:hypothetical protein
VGEKFQESLKLQFDKRLKLEFQGAKIGRRALEKQAAGTNTLSRFETEVLITGRRLITATSAACAIIHSFASTSFR